MTKPSALEIEIVPLEEPLSGSLRAVSILIDGRDLADLVMDAESDLRSERWHQIRLADAELSGYGSRERTARNLEPTDPIRSPGHLAMPRHLPGLVGEGDEMEEGDDGERRTIVLGCSCGEPGHEEVGVVIERHSNLFVWRDLEVLQESWPLSLGPFTFPAPEYVGAVTAALDRLRHS